MDSPEAWPPSGADRARRSQDHNNIAEASLRRVALGRKNFLFVGNEDAGHDLAVLYTLAASCEKHGVNPIDYFTDVLTRVHSHPAREVLELLPHRWKPPDNRA